MTWSCGSPEWTSPAYRAVSKRGYISTQYSPGFCSCFFLFMTPPMIIMEAMERKINYYLRIWLGFPRSLSSAALYGSSNSLQLPFKGLMEGFVVSRTREVMLYRNSKDPKVATAGSEVRTWREWGAKKELGYTEERLRQKALMGTVVIGRAGPGYFPSTQIHKVKGKQRGNLIEEEVRASVEEERRSKIVELSRQGAWTRCEIFVKKKKKKLVRHLARRR